jgi:hypothetical protein
MPRPPALVCQFLENVSAEFLELHQDLVKRYASGPGRHGIYALYSDGRLYYVGLASNLRNRLRGHLKDRHRGLWDRFSMYITVSDEHIRELEALLLRITGPEGNRQKGRFRRAENLKPPIEAEVHERSRRADAIMMGRRLNEGTPRRKTGSRGVKAIQGRLRRPMAIRGWYKGEVYKARLRTNGSVRWNGEVYKTPGFAARAACGRSVNGLWFWHYQREPGQWVRLRELKQ